LGTGVALIRSLAVPLRRLCIVLRNTEPLILHRTDVVMPDGEPLVRREAVQFHGLRVV
jgi:hypothetical protein